MSEKWLKKVEFQHADPQLRFAGEVASHLEEDLGELVEAVKEGLDIEYWEHPVRNHASAPVFGLRLALVDLELARGHWEYSFQVEIGRCAQYVLL